MYECAGVYSYTWQFETSTNHKRDEYWHTTTLHATCILRRPLAVFFSASIQTADKPHVFVLYFFLLKHSSRVIVETTLSIELYTHKILYTFYYGWWNKSHLSHSHLTRVESTNHFRITANLCDYKVSCVQAHLY